MFKCDEKCYNLLSKKNRFPENPKRVSEFVTIWNPLRVSETWFPRSRKPKNQIKISIGYQPRKPIKGFRRCIFLVLNQEPPDCYSRSRSFCPPDPAETERKDAWKSPYSVGKQMISLEHGSTTPAANFHKFFYWVPTNLLSFSARCVENHRKKTCESFRAEYRFHVPAISYVFLRNTVIFRRLSCRFLGSGGQNDRPRMLDLKRNNILHQLLTFKNRTHHSYLVHRTIDLNRNKYFISFQLLKSNLLLIFVRLKIGLNRNKMF